MLSLSWGPWTHWAPWVPTMRANICSTIFLEHYAFSLSLLWNEQRGKEFFLHYWNRKIIPVYWCLVHSYHPRGEKTLGWCWDRTPARERFINCTMASQPFLWIIILNESGTHIRLKLNKFYHFCDLYQKFWGYTTWVGRLTWLPLPTPQYRIEIAIYF